ncbi:MAG: dihydrofolate reductase [Sphingobacteriales bacterium]|nr:MAG: dihydrofolate reductase [Sphingobacteriales bacterium]
MDASFHFLEHFSDQKLIYGINLTLDGCCDHTKGTGGDDIHEYFAALLEQADQVIYGRKTYELMVPFWPEVARAQSMDKASNRFALVFDKLEKLVFSRTLTSVDDRNSRLLHGDLQEEVLKLKQQPGKAISTGGVDLPGQLIALGLVDEFHVVVHPVIAGEGRRLFDDLKLQETLGLKLMEINKLDGGRVALHYVR